jgi:spore coat polysaccharide biosynthesis predicted glycosyltransferase SpsG
LKKLKVLLVCFVSPNIGVGHLSRLLALAQALRRGNKVTPDFLIFGSSFKERELSNFSVNHFALDDDFKITIENILEADHFNLIVFDLYPKHNINNLGGLFRQFKSRNLHLIGIDSLVEYCNILDLIWIPSFNHNYSKHSDPNCDGLLKSGWDSFLIQKQFQHKNWSPGSKILILTGGSDVANLGEVVPEQLDKLLDNNIELNWVRGPFANAPNLPKKCRLNWIIHDAPAHLDELIVQSNYVMTVFGVSFFEVLQYGIPTVVFSPYGNKDNDELNALSKEGVAMVVNNFRFAINGLIELIDNDDLAKEYSMNALNKMSINGGEKLSKEIYSLMGLK